MDTREHDATIDALVRVLEEEFSSRLSPRTNPNSSGSVLVTPPETPLVKGYTNQILIFRMHHKGIDAPEDGDAAVVVRLQELESQSQPWRSLDYLAVEIACLRHLESKATDELLKQKVPRFWKRDRRNIAAGQHETPEDFLFAFNPPHDPNRRLVGVAYTALPGQALQSLPSTDHHALLLMVRQTGDLVGRLHLALSGLFSADAQPFGGLSLKRAKELKDIKEPINADFVIKEANLRAQICRERGREQQASALERCVSVLESQLTASDVTTLPQGIVHTDLSLSNFLWDSPNGNPTITGLVDFDFCTPGPLLHDLGFMIPMWCVSDNTIDQQLIEALISSYGVHRPLTETEKKLLLPYSLCVWLRSLAWLNREENWADNGIQAFEQRRREVLLNLCDSIEVKKDQQATAPSPDCLYNRLRETCIEFIHSMDLLPTIGLPDLDRVRAVRTKDYMQHYGHVYYTTIARPGEHKSMDLEGLCDHLVQAAPFMEIPVVEIPHIMVDERKNEAAVKMVMQMRAKNSNESLIPYEVQWVLSLDDTGTKVKVATEYIDSYAAEKMARMIAEVNGLPAPAGRQG